MAFFLLSGSNEIVYTLSYILSRSCCSDFISHSSLLAFPKTRVRERERELLSEKNHRGKKEIKLMNILNR